MVRNNYGTSLLRLMMNRTGDMVGRGLTSSIRTIDVTRQHATGGGDQCRGSEEFRRRERG